MYAEVPLAGLERRDASVVFEWPEEHLPVGKARLIGAVSRVGVLTRGLTMMCSCLPGPGGHRAVRGGVPRGRVRCSRGGVPFRGVRRHAGGTPCFHSGGPRDGACRPPARRPGLGLAQRGRSARARSRRPRDRLADRRRRRGGALRQAERRADEAERTREETARRHADEERLRIGREMHDSLTHQISIIKVQAEAAVHVARRRGEQIPEVLLAIQEAAREATRECARPGGAAR